MSLQIMDWLTVVVVSMLTVVEAVATAMGLMVNSVVYGSIGVMVDGVVMVPVPTVVSQMVMFVWGGL